MEFILNVYRLVKTIVCTYEKGAINEFEEFENFVNGGFLK